MAARNEDWCLGLTARAALMWLDELVILDHASTDGTRGICDELRAEFGTRLHKITESDPVWEEMRHRQRMLDIARQNGATHICYIDADEILTGDLLQPVPGQTAQRIRGLFHILPPNSIMQIPWLALRGSIGQVHIRGPWADGQIASFGFIDDPRLGWSSAGRGGYDFHHRQPMGKPLVPWTPLASQGLRSGLMHLQFVSGRRLRAKQALYKLTEVLRWPGREPVERVDWCYNLAVYGQYKTPTAPLGADPTLTQAPMGNWWDAYLPLMKHFKPHALPWQEAECLRLIEEHGIKRFEGLDLFGIGETSVHART